MFTKHKLELIMGNLKVFGTLNNSETAQKIMQCLPFRARMRRWGGELYFALPEAIDDQGESTSSLQAGTLAFWAPGNAFCIFFGPTPMSTGFAPVPSSEVCIIGSLDSIPKELFSIPESTQVELFLTE
ncbi:cyclophilin-like fold protein [Vibrio parahaemolyticus]